jgi:hypothetical protein
MALLGATWSCSLSRPHSRASAAGHSSIMLLMPLVTPQSWCDWRGLCWCCCCWAGRGLLHLRCGYMSSRLKLSTFSVPPLRYNSPVSSLGSPFPLLCHWAVVILFLFMRFNSYDYFWFHWSFIGKLCWGTHGELGSTMSCASVQLASSLFWN